MSTEQESTFEYTQEYIFDPTDPNEDSDSEIAATEILPQSESSQISKENRTTAPYMTKFEQVRIISTRYLQIANGAPIMVNIQNEIDPYDIVLRELHEKKVPLIVRRHLPSGMYEDWNVDELEIL